MIPKRDLNKHAKAFLLNGEQKINNAKLIADQNHDYGNAVSLLITASEELVKCVLVESQRLGFDFFNKVPGIDHLFKQHGCRPYVFLMLSGAKILGDTLLDALKKGGEDPAAMMEQLKDIDSAMKKMFSKILEIFKHFHEEIDWYMNLESIRQAGLYVDISPQLLTPSSTSEEEYESTLYRVENLYKVVKGIDDGVPSILDESKESLDDVKGQLSANNDSGYKIIGEKIQYVRKKRNKPFLEIQDFLQEIIVEIEKLKISDAFEKEVNELKERGGFE
jgi:AbiV family abortive infection protein